jgi:hypothetical protein
MSTVKLTLRLNPDSVKDLAANHLLDGFSEIRSILHYEVEVWLRAVYAKHVPASQQPHPHEEPSINAIVLDWVKNGRVDAEAEAEAEVGK